VTNSWKPYIIWTDGTVTLGDSSTTKPIYSILTIPLELSYKDGITVVKTISMCIMDMVKTDFIVGLPDIIESLFFIFIES
jgi:hypothetical protein